MKAPPSFASSWCCCCRCHRVFSPRVVAFADVCPGLRFSVLRPLREYKEALRGDVIHVNPKKPCRVQSEIPAGDLQDHYHTIENAGPSRHITSKPIGFVSMADIVQP
eukprot:scaffold2541_cov175-Amphora_coffeaeformis.AAC.8